MDILLTLLINALQIRFIIIASSNVYVFYDLRVKRIILEAGGDRQNDLENQATAPKYV